MPGGLSDIYVNSIGFRGGSVADYLPKARLEKILQNTEVGAMIAAFGCGIGTDNFNVIAEGQVFFQ